MRSAFRLVIAAMLALGFAEGSAAQTAPVASSSAEDDPTTVEDVVVLGLRARPAASDYVASVGAPAPGRKLAAWKDSICVGVGGMQPEPASVIADRVSDWGFSLGLRIAEPGCRPNIVIIAASDGDATAKTLVARQPQNFRTGVSGTTAGTAALRDFQTSGRKVRWWHVSLPVNADTLAPVVRLRGQPPFSGGVITRPADLGSFGMTTSASRLSDNTRDLLAHVIVVVEASALQEVNFSELSDYISMVALAQIDPDASPAAPSILTLFDEDETRPRESTLTEWDRAYLEALYATSQGAASLGANELAVAQGLLRRVQSNRSEPIAID